VLKICNEFREGEKIPLQDCHPIILGYLQVVRMFSSCDFHVPIAIYPGAHNVTGFWKSVTLKYIEIHTYTIYAPVKCNSRDNAD